MEFVKTFGLTEFIDDIQISIYNLIQIAVTFVGDSDNDGEEPKGFRFDPIQIAAFKDRKGVKQFLQIVFGRGHLTVADIVDEHFFQIVGVFYRNVFFFVMLNVNIDLILFIVLMRRRCWIPTAALLALGLVFYFAVYGFRFAGVLLFLAAGVVLAFGIVDALRGRFPRFSRWATRLGLILVCLGLLLAAGTAGWVVSAGRGAADPEAQWVVVLGAGVNGTVPSQALRERLEAAQDYLARYPEAIAVLSGAQGDGEAITEAQCMYDWLTARGVDPARLRMETKATTTEENLRCSLDLIEAETGTRPAQIAVVSGEYHLLRAELLARRAGAEALGVPSYTHDRAFYCLMLAREVCGVWAALLF